MKQNLRLRKISGPSYLGAFWAWAGGPALEFMPLPHRVSMHSIRLRLILASDWLRSRYEASSELMRIRLGFRRQSPGREKPVFFSWQFAGGEKWVWEDGR